MDSKNRSRQRYSPETGQFKQLGRGRLTGKRFLEDLAYHNPEEMDELQAAAAEAEAEADPEEASKLAGVSSIPAALQKKNWNYLDEKERSQFVSEKRFAKAKAAYELDKWYNAEVKSSGLAKRYLRTQEDI